MPTFFLHFRRGLSVDVSEAGMEFRDVHHAYVEVCKSVPDMARDLLVQGRDPMDCAYLICDAKGQRLMEVPFTDVLSPAEWRLRKARRRPLSNLRSTPARDDLALTAFRRMFGSADVACVLLTPELTIREITDFGARHSHVDADAVRGASILDIFDLRDKPKADFSKFMRLAQTGAVSEIVDLPYYVLDEAGDTAQGWWKARLWPIFDDDDNMIGIVEWAEPFTRPISTGSTIVRVAPGSTC